MYAGTSAGCLRVGTCPCKYAILLVEASFFELLILFTILANCGTMAWGSPLDPPGSWKARVLALCEQVVLVMFTAEIATKVLAYGLLFTRQPYLRDPWCLWCQLDLVGLVTVVRGCRSHSRM